MATQKKQDTKAWTMDLDGHVPGFGSAIPTGMYLAKVAKQESSSTDKGNRVKFTFSVTAGEQKGRTVNAFLYIIDADFNGSDGHRSVTLDNWYNLLVAMGIKPGKADMRKLAQKLVGRPIGLDVKQQEPDEKGRIFSNVDDFLPPSAVSSEAADDDDSDDEDSSVEEIEDTPEIEDSPEVEEPKKKKASKKKAEPEPSDDEDEDSVETFDVDDID